MDSFIRWILSDFVVENNPSNNPTKIETIFKRDFSSVSFSNKHSIKEPFFLSLTSFPQQAQIYILLQPNHVHL